MRLPREEFKVLLYGPDLPKSGLRARAHFEPGLLVFAGSGHWYTPTLDKIGLKSGGFDGRQWFLTWDSPMGQFTALLQGDSAVDSFIKRAPESLAERLHLIRRAYFRRFFNRSLALGVVGALVFLPIFALAWYALNAERFAQWAATQMSLEQKEQLGDRVFAEMETQVKLLPEHALADEAVERIGVRLTGGSVHTFHFHVVDDAQVSVVALPGGHVIVSTGLLQAVNCADELAGVLAHATSHVELRHSLKIIIERLGLPAVWAAVWGDMDADVWGDAANEMVYLTYSPEMERDADMYALRMLLRAGIPAEGMVRFFENVAKLEASEREGNQVTGNSTNPFDVLRGHPVSAARMQALQQAIDAQGSYIQKPIVLDWMALKNSL